MRGDTIQYHPEFPSQYIAPRNIEVWLPPGYEERAGDGYPVLYMHDGQNVYNPETSRLSHVAWGVDEALKRLAGAGRARPAIVVAIWHGAQRGAELMPQKPLDTLASADVRAALVAEYGELQGDAYLKFVTGELKPFIDRTYATLTGGADTFIMGSSMGGLMSFYAIAEYPDVFGGAAGLSAHWPIAGGIMVEYLRQALPDPRTHKLYFDHGTDAIDAQYEPYLAQLDEIASAAGYVEGEDWMTRKFVGAVHSETAWRERVWIPLEFLFPATRKDTSDERR